MVGSQSRELYLKAFLQEVTPQPERLAAFFDCLDSIEFIGVKWICSVPAREFKDGMYGHIVDELGHHQMLGQLSSGLRSKMSGDSLKLWQNYSSQGRTFTETYLLALFRRTAQAIVKNTSKEGRNRHCYYLLSLLIERRLMTIYPLLLGLVTQTEIKKAVEKLVEDERSHLALVSQGIKPISDETELDIDALAKIETQLARQWIDQLSLCMGIKNESGSFVSGPRRSLSDGEAQTLA